MNITERYIENYCDQFYDCEISYCIEDEEFYYDMHEKYNHEMLITFPQDSSNILDFLEGLNKIFHKDDDVYWTENWGEESGYEKDRIWVWW